MQPHCNTTHYDALTAAMDSNGLLFARKLSWRATNHNSSIFHRDTEAPPTAAQQRSGPCTVHRIPLQQLPTQLRLFFFGFVHAFQLSLFAFCFFSCHLFFFQQYGRCPERGTKKRNHHGTKAQKPRPWIQQNSNDHCFEPGSILRQSLKHFFGRFFGNSGGLHVVALSGVVNLVWPSSVDSVFAYSTPKIHLEK